jgi:TRAP-type mannitol/chloroaromatic compound transport system permease large subunit
MTLPEVLAIVMVAAMCGLLLVGYPVALTIGGVSLAFALLANALGVMSFSLLGAFPQRVFGIMTNEVLLAIPLFVFMGVMLERSRVAEDLLETMGRLFGSLTGGLAIAVTIVGVLLAAAKGIVGATTVTMGLIVLPTMLRHGYDPRLAAGTVAATATLAQIFPPATVLVLLGDQMSNAYQAAQLAQGNFAPQSVTVSDLFAGAIVPAFALVLLYLLFLIAVAFFFPKTSPAIPPEPGAPHGFALARRLAEVLVAPLALIVAVLGSILCGLATPTESASIGALGAILLGLRRFDRPQGRAKGGIKNGIMSWLNAWTRTVLVPVMHMTTQVTSMIFVILIGATLFSLVFRGLGGDEMVHRALADLPGGVAGAVLAVMLAVFLLGFVMDAFEIIFVVVPIVAPALLKMPGVDPVWLAVMLAMNLQTSYIHPPLGPTLFFLRGVAPPQITTAHIYVGIIPFVLIQIVMMAVLWFVPALATFLPHALYGG